MGVFDQAHAFWQDLLAQRIAQERRAARDGAAVDCLHKMTNQRRCDPFVEQNRIGTCLGTARTCTLYRARRCGAANILRLAHIGLKDAGVVVIVTFHPRAGAADRDARQANVGPRVAAGKAIGGCCVNLAARISSAGFRNLRDPGIFLRRRLCAQGVVLQGLRVGFGRFVAKFQIAAIRLRGQLAWIS